MSILNGSLQISEHARFFNSMNKAGKENAVPPVFSISIQSNRIEKEVSRKLLSDMVSSMIPVIAK